MEDQAIQLAIKFAEIMSRSSASVIQDRREIARNKKDVTEQAQMYDSIVNDLLNDKLELEFIAREYKELYEKVSISDEDIEHLQRTIERALSAIQKFSGQDEKTADYEMFINLVSKDTLKTMQLLGFNYKEAIGQPLTEACANAITRSLGGNNQTKQPTKKR